MINKSVDDLLQNVLIVELAALDRTVVASCGYSCFILHSFGPHTILQVWTKRGTTTKKLNYYLSACKSFHSLF